MATRIIVFDDNIRLRHSLQVLLDGVEGYFVCGEFENCDNAVEMVKELQPDVIIMDINMPGTDGLEGLKKIKEKFPGVYIIMHTVFEEEEQLFQCLCAGANGYILKNTSFISLLDAIDNVIHGGAPLSPTIAKKVLESFHHSTPGRLIYHLSEREAEIVGFLVKGYSYKMIANACKISLDTVRGHIRNIYTKLHVNCGREAVVKALRDRII